MLKLYRRGCLYRLNGFNGRDKARPNRALRCSYRLNGLDGLTSKISLSDGVKKRIKTSCRRIFLNYRER